MAWRESLTTISVLRSAGVASVVAATIALVPARRSRRRSWELSPLVTVTDELHEGPVPGQKMRSPRSNVPERVSEGGAPDLITLGAGAIVSIRVCTGGDTITVT